MKMQHWLFLSASLNLVMIVGFFSRQPASIPVSSGPTGHATASSAASLPAARNVTVPAVSWMQAMREAGISEQRLGEIAAADFESRWQQRLLEAQRRYNHGELTDNALALLRLEHDAEEEADLRATLGPDGYARWDHENTLRAFDRSKLNLSPNDTESLYKLCKELQRQQRDSERARLEGTMDEGDADRKAGDAQSQYDQQLKALLGNDRYAAVQKDNDPGSGGLRRQLLALNVTPDQVSAALQAQQKIDDQRAKLDDTFHAGQVSGPDYDQQVKALDDARAEALQKALGPETYAEFQNDQDTRYQTLKQYGTVWGLTDTDVKTLFNTIQDYDKNIRDYQARARATEAQGRVVDWNGVQEALHGYSRQTESALQKALGAPLVIKLQQHNVLGFDTE